MIADPCRLPLDLDVASVAKIDSMLAQATEADITLLPAPVPTPTNRFARDPGEYATRVGNQLTLIHGGRSPNALPWPGNEKWVTPRSEELLLADEVTRRAPAADLSGDKAGKLRRHSKDIRRLVKRFGASNIRVFGSVARGQDDTNRDIDLLVDFDVSQGLTHIVDLRDKLAALLGESVDVAPVALLRADIARKVLAEAVPI